MLDRIYTKEEVHDLLRKIHDDIKRHPFRVGFETRYVAGYKRLLYELTEAWCKIIYYCKDATEEEERLYQQFGKWIHDFRQELCTWDRDKFPMSLFPYYEQMLQITHIYLDTGILDTYYNPDPFWDKQGQRWRRVEKYQLITKEMCGIDSPVLPRFYPVGTKIITDERVKEYFLKEKYYYPNKSEEERLALYEEWKRDTKPVLDWINSNITDDKWTHPVWKATL